MQTYVRREREIHQISTCHSCNNRASVNSNSFSMRKPISAPTRSHQMWNSVSLLSFSCVLSPRALSTMHILTLLINKFQIIFKLLLLFLVFHLHFFFAVNHFGNPKMRIRKRASTRIIDKSDSMAHRKTKIRHMPNGHTHTRTLYGVQYNSVSSLKSTQINTFYAMLFNGNIDDRRRLTNIR